MAKFAENKNQERRMKKRRQQ